jgi:endonuclease-8
VPEGDTIHRAARAIGVLTGERLRVEAIHPRAQATGVAPRIDGRRLERVSAHGKNLLLQFEGALILRSHLGMKGSWRVVPSEAPLAGRPWLVLRGARHQAVLRGGSRLEVATRHVTPLGPDVLATPLALREIVANLRRVAGDSAIGDALLDQRLVAGIGNIWRSEALWETRVSPWTAVSDLSDDELRAVIDSAAGLMRMSVQGRRPQRSVYRRTGRGCRRCGTPVVARAHGDNNRTSYWCPTCQRGKEHGEA